MKNLTLFLFIAAVFSSLIIFSPACNKDLDIPDDDDPTQDTIFLVIEGIRVSNGAVIEKGFTHVKIKAEFAKISAQTFTIVDYGHVVSKTNTLPTIQNNDGIGAAGTERTSIGDFVSHVTDLEPGASYYARVFIKKKDKSSGAESYGYTDQSFSFTTRSPEPPTVVDTVKNVLSGSFLLEGRIIDFKGKDALDHGFVWSTTHADNAALTVDQNEGKHAIGPKQATESHLFEHLVQGLEPNTTYFARAYAVNEFGAGYGPVLQITTLAAPEPNVVIDTFFLVSDANGTGQPNPGEQVTYKLVLKNIGDKIAENVNVILSSGDVNVLSSQPIEFGNIVTNGGTQSKNIQFQISNLTSAGDAVLINTEINSGAFQWTDNSTFTFILIAPPVPEVKIDAIDLVWDANGTGQPNPGELVTYNIVLKNTGEITAENVEVTFTSPHASVVGTQPVSFGSIPVDGTKSKQVQLQISNQAVSGSTVLVNTQINSGSFQWVYPSVFSFTIYPPPAPVFVIQNVTLTEPNGTGNINPGEQVTIGITLKNNGNADASGVGLSIGTSPHYTITTPLPVSYGSILQGASQTKDVIIQLGASVPWNTQVTIPVTVTDDQGGQWTFPNAVQFTVISPYVVSSGLAFYLRCNECSGTTASSVVGSNTGQIFGAQFSNDIIPGTTGCSMNFNAASQNYIQFPSNPIAGFSNVSVSFWMKTLTGNAYLMAIQSTSSAYLRISDNKFYPSNFGVDGSFELPLSNWLQNEWTHFVLVANDSGKSKLYVNGAGVYEKNASFYIGSGTGLYVGRGFSGSNPYFNGKMDNIRIYNRALTAAEVTTIFNAKQ
jgi:uncharacterized repeat protein (TIGR01451 family)